MQRRRFPSIILILAGVHNAIEVLAGCQVGCQERWVLVPPVMFESVIRSRRAVHDC